MQRLLTTTILVGLLVATAAAFAITEKLKLERSPIYGTLVLSHFSPVCGCARGKATIRIELRHGDRVTVTMLDSHGRPVRVLVSDQRVSRGPTVFRWDGRTDEGQLAPDGLYKAEVHLAGQHRTIVLPNPIRLDTVPPAFKNVVLDRDTFSPDGDKQADSLVVHYELTKPSHVIAYIGGTRFINTQAHRSSGHFTWDGTVHGVPLRAGSYTIELGAKDLAGNSTPVADRWRIHVTIRFIQLASRHIVARRGMPFQIGVSTDARRYTWKLGSRTGVASGPVLRVRAPRQKGRFTLTVTENGHSDQAAVVVR